MVARFVPRRLMAAALLGGMALFAPFLAHADLEAAAGKVAAYRALQEKIQDAVARQDGAAYEALGKESVSLLAEARAAYEAGGAARSEDPEVIYNYAEVIKLEGDDDLGAEMVRAALDRGVGSPALWRIYGEMRLAMGRPYYADGVEALLKSTELDGASPTAADAWFALGRYYLQSDLPEAGAKAFASALAANPSHVPAQLGDAAAKVYAGDIAGAGGILEKVGRAAQPHDVMLRALMRSALADFDLSRRTFSDTVENHFAYARVAYIAARFPEAALAARRAANLAGNREDMYNFAGAIQMQMGDLPSALDSYQNSLRIKADQAPIQQTVEQLRQAVQQQQAQQPPVQSAQPTAPVGAGQGPLR